MSAELTIATPVLLLVVLAIVQFAVWSHATQIAQAAAAQGLSALRVQHGSVAAGSERTRQVLDQLGPGPLVGVDVTCTRDVQSATVRVSGTASPVIPLVELPVEARAVGPVERFVPHLAGR